MTGFLSPPDLETGSIQYARRFAGEAGAYLLDIQERGVKNLVQTAPADLRNAVDVGGGHGQLVPALLSMGLQTTVLGSTPDCAEKLMQGAEAAEVRFVTGRLLDLPFATCAFDLVISIRLLAHIDDSRKLIDELCRVARRSVIVDYPTLVGANALSAATFPIKRLIEKDTRTYRSFWPGQIEQAFRRNGFTLKGTFKQFTAPMGLHRLGGKPIRVVEEGLRRIGVTGLIGNPVLQRFDREAS